MPSPEPLRRSFASLLGAQLVGVGRALVREGAILAAALAFVCLLSFGVAVRHGEQLVLEPALLSPALLVALLLPWAVWKGDPPFGRAFLWTLPVARQHAAIAKVIAGAVWLVVAMLVTFAALGLTVLASGGGIGADHTRLVAGAGGELTPVVWRAPWWMWLMPFVNALTLYLATSAAVLGLRHPLRLLAGLAFAIGLVVVLVVNLAPGTALEDSMEELTGMIIEGRFGLDYALYAGEESLSYYRRAPGTDPLLIWRAMPHIGGWAAAIGVWAAAALLALALALRRHWER